MGSGANSVAVLGTGIIGSAMARNVAAAGMRTAAWNRSVERAEPLAEDGVSIAALPAEAVAGAEVVITALTDGDAVQDVMAHKRTVDAMAADAVWLQMSTIGIDATDEARALADGAGVEFVDAPVVGTKEPAEEGKLIVLASGRDETLDRCAPVFDAVGARTLRLGEAGAGTRMKLIVNDWLIALTTGLAETFALADTVGVDPRQFLDVISGGPVDAGYAQLKGGMMIDREYPTSFPLRLAAKDARLVLDAANGLDLPLSSAALGRLQEAAEMGLADEDIAAVYEAATAREDRRPAAAA